MINIIEEIIYIKYFLITAFFCVLLITYELHRMAKRLDKLEKEK